MHADVRTDARGKAKGHFASCETRIKKNSLLEIAWITTEAATGSLQTILYLAKSRVKTTAAKQD
jgi:hypothetical protein